MYDIRNKTTDQKNTILMDTKLLCEDIRTIRLKRNGDSALGFAIRGGMEVGLPVLVSEVYSNSEAEREGLKPGDQILRVNGYSIEQAIHDEVISLIKSASKIILLVKSTGVVPVRQVKDDRTKPIQWKFISDLQQPQTNKMNQSKANTSNSNNSLKTKQYKQLKPKTKCPIHSLKKDDGQIVKILLKNEQTATKLKPNKTSNSIELNSAGSTAGSSPTSSVSSKYSSSITSSLSSCSKLIAKSCKSALSSSSSSRQPTKATKLNGYYSRSLSNLTTSTDFIDEFSLTSTSTINFTRNKSTSNLNLEIASSLSPEQTTPDQTTSSSTDDDSSTLEKVKSTKCSTIFINLSNGESLGCGVIKGPNHIPGTFIQTIKPNGVAQRSGLEIGDQIVSLNDSSCLAEHMEFEDVIKKIKSCKQMKFKVKKSKKNSPIMQFLEQASLIAATKSNRKIAKKPILNDPSSSSCNESATSPIEHISSISTNYSRRSSSSKNHHFNSTCNSHHLPYHLNKYSSKQNLNKLSSSNYLKGQFNQFTEKTCPGSLSGSSKRSLRRNIAHHRSYTSLIGNSNNSTYGQRMNGYHSPVCLRHSSTNYYSQSENDYSMYEMETHNEKKKIDFIINEDKLMSAKSRNESYGYCKNGKQFKSKSIRNLNRSTLYDCEKCSCINYYPQSDCTEFDYHKKLTSTFNLPINSNLLKQKLLCNHLSCSDLTFKSQTELGISNCQKLCTMLNNQMNALKLNHLNEDVKSQSNLELNEDLILNNKLYEKMRLENERLAIERKKLEAEQMRLKEEKDEFERKKKQMETIKQHEESKSISNTKSNTSTIANQSTNTSTTQSIGFLDEIKKLAERRTCDNALITDTLNKTRFNTGSELKGAVRLLPIADSKIKLHTDDEKKRKQHDALMQEFRLAHEKMFGSKNNNNSSIDNSHTNDDTDNETNSKPIIVASAITNLSTLNSTISSTNLEKSDLNEPSTEMTSSNMNFDKFTCDNSTTGNTNSIANLTINSTTNISTSNIVNHQTTPPPLPPSSTTTTLAINKNCNITATDNNQDIKFRKLNTFGKLIQPTDQQRLLNVSNNVLPKNNLNGLNETVKILRTSSSSKKYPAPPPPIQSKIVKITKKDEKITFLNGVSSNNNLFSKNQQQRQQQNQIKMDGLKTGSIESSNANIKYTQDHLVEKSNYLKTTASDISLSSLSIVQVQVPTK